MMEFNNLIGFILPPIIDLINSRIEDARIKYIISLVVCLFVAAILNLPKLNALSVDGFLRSAGIIFAEAQTVYKLYWSTSKPRSVLLERLTP